MKPAERKMKMDEQTLIVELKTALRAALGYIDALPPDLELPAMPGFDRDWVDSLLQAEVATI